VAHSKLESTINVYIIDVCKKKKKQVNFLRPFHSYSYIFMEDFFCLVFLNPFFFWNVFSFFFLFFYMFSYLKIISPSTLTIDIVRFWWHPQADKFEISVP